MDGEEPLAIPAETTPIFRWQTLREVGQFDLPYKAGVRCRPFPVSIFARFSHTTIG
jgi:hypothetical protein